MTARPRISGKRPAPPPAVHWIAKTLENAGYETWAVGGAVRDALFGAPSGDWDLTTRATPVEVQRIFQRTVPLGVDHGTVGVLAREGTMFEVTTFRRDVETTGRHAVVEFAESLNEDLSRRDFTINAVAWHPLREVVHDPFGGRSDMEGRILKTVGDPNARFAEDYLRVLRGLRFAGTFQLTIEPATWRALVAAVDELGVLSPERMREELDKVLVGRAPPSGSLALYAAAGVLRRMYPEIEAARGLPRGTNGGGAEWFSHSLRCVDLLSNRRLDLRWAALLQAVGGAGSNRAVLRAAAVLERLRSSNARVQGVASLVEWIVRPPDPGGTEEELRRWIAEVGRTELAALMRIWAASVRSDEAHGSGEWTRSEFGTLCRRLRGIARSGAPLSVSELRFTGRDLIRMGYAPGPEFGDVLVHLLDAVLQDPSRNDPEWLEIEAERWMERVP